MKHTIQFTVSALLLTLLLLPAPPALGQQSETVEIPVTDISSFAPVDDLVEANTSLFKHNEFLAMLQVNAVVDRSALYTKESVDEGVEAVYEILFQVCQQGEVRAQDHWKRIDWSPSFEERDMNQQIPEIARYGVQPGQYEVVVRVSDVHARKVQTIQLPVTVGYFSAAGLELSDMVFASEVDPSGRSEEYDLHGITVVPRVDNTFGDGRETMTWFAEAYNMTSTGKIRHIRVMQLLDSLGHDALPPDTIVFDPHRPDRAFWGDVDLTGVPAGDYTFKMTLIDTSRGQRVSNQKSLTVQRVELTEDLAAIKRAGLLPDSTTDEMVDIEFRAMQYLLPQVQRNANRNITDPQKMRIYLSTLYAHLDPDTTTEKNEFRELFLNRINEAFERFGRVRGYPGWKRDRGRVLITYGEPDYIERHSMEIATAHAFEIWEYEQIEGGVVFVFVDRSDLGLYSLVHSTKRGELSNPNWRMQELLVQSESNDNRHLESLGAVGVGR